MKTLNIPPTTSPVRVQFWGTRGSLAKPGRNTVRYGGNTSCVQVTSPGGSLVILDCGTGTHDLGRTLLAEAKGPLRGSILFSHTHWDHIQGFPFFAPLFVPGGHWDIYGPSGLGRTLRDTLSAQMEHTYFPVTLEELGASIEFHDLVEGTFEIDDIRITTRYLNHPALTLGYRLEMGSASVVYSCDHEPHSRPAEPTGQVHELDRRHAEFLAGADLVIHDAQFTEKEYQSSRKGWGHSPIEYVCEMGELAGVKRMALTHHDPGRTDDALDELVHSMQRTLQERHSPLEIFAAADMQVVEIDASGRTRRDEAGAQSSAMPASKAALTDLSVIIGVSNAKWASLLSEAASAEGVTTHQVPNAAAAVGMATATPPALILLEDQPATGIDGLSVCASLRADPKSRFKETFIVIVADRERPAEGAAAGVTQWLIAPFTAHYARAQIKAWLMRSACRWVRAALPPDEEHRLASLRELSILDTPSEERFDRITRVATALADVPLGLVTLVDKDRQWFKSCVGALMTETSREPSFCAHVVLCRKAVIVPDTFEDDRFADNPLVVGGPRIRFYAGFPVFHDNGSCLGTLCLIDVRPRQFSETILQRFEDLAGLVQQEINAKRR